MYKTCQKNLLGNIKEGLSKRRRTPSYVMSVLKLLYGFNATPIRFPTIYKFILNLYRRTKGKEELRNSQRAKKRGNLPCQITGIIKVIAITVVGVRNTNGIVGIQGAGTYTSETGV